MASRTRDNILARRSGAINSVIDKTASSGALDFDAMVRDGMWKFNGTAQIGIATATETGLTPDRFPVRIVITDNAQQSNNVDAVLRYWKLENAAGETVRFDRKVPLNLRVVEHYYAAVADMDDIIWESYHAVAGQVSEGAESPELGVIRTTAYANANMAVITEALYTVISAAIKDLIAQSTAAMKYVRLQVAENIYMVGRPAGSTCVPLAGYSSNQIAVLETLACITANSQILAETYVDLNVGVRTLASFCIANIFRYGLFEAYEGREYYTLVCTMQGAASRIAVVNAIIAPPGAPALARFPVGTTIDTTAARGDAVINQQAMGAVFMAGVNHYSFNHTTGGNVCTGPLLSLLATADVFKKGQTDAEMMKTTDLFYQALHPVNKRAIANIFFKNSKVWTHGKLAGARMYNRFATDAFVQIRTNPYPAGAHKAYLCALVLKRVVAAHLSAFLPWRESMNECINSCKEVLSMGARAHIGSHYYTGESGTHQSSELDNYLPELAFYIQTMARFDSVAMSPHMSQEVMSRADVSWQTLIKSIKSADLSQAKTESIQKFLSSAGVGTLNFNPDDEATYANEIQNERAALENLAQFL